MDIHWKWFKFEQLSVYQLYALLKLRETVFAIEQQCLYADLDDYDQTAWHLLAYQQDKLTAYARIRLQADKRITWIERIVTDKHCRGKGLGKEIMQQCLKWCQENSHNTMIQLKAQHHLEKFYQAYGFVTISKPFDEAGILHIKMELQHEKY